MVELLVVILILGLLAAIAIPSLAGPRRSAGDASAKSLAVAARLAARMVALDNGGSFAGVSKATLRKSEPTIVTKKGSGDAYLSAASGTASTYTVTVTSTTGSKFTVARASNGTVALTCKVRKAKDGPGGCKLTKGVNGTW